MTALPEITRQHLARTRDFYEEAPTTPKWGGLFYRRQLAHYYNLLIPAEASVLEIGCGSGELLARLRARHKVGVDLSPRQLAAARARVPGAEFHEQSGEALALDGRFDCIIISDTLNFAADVQRLFEQLHRVAHPDTRLFLNFHNSLWRPVLTLATWLGLKDRQMQNSWLAASDVRNLLQLGGWTTITQEGRLLLPVDLFGLEALANRWLSPLLQWFCLTVFLSARPLRPASARPPTRAAPKAGNQPRGR